MDMKKGTKNKTKTTQKTNNIPPNLTSEKRLEYLYFWNNPEMKIHPQALLWM